MNLLPGYPWGASRRSRADSVSHKAYIDCALCVDRIHTAEVIGAVAFCRSPKSTCFGYGCWPVSEAGGRSFAPRSLASAIRSGSPRSELAAASRTVNSRFDISQSGRSPGALGTHCRCRTPFNERQGGTAKTKAPEAFLLSLGLSAFFKSVSE